MRAKRKRRGAPQRRRALQRGTPRPGAHRHEQRLGRPTTDRYARAGVDTARQDTALGPLRELLAETFAFSPERPVLGLRQFANVIDLGHGRGLAITTDGVGTKVLVAQAVGRYDTVGIDCVAMNANDILCVGARPVAMVDYLAVEKIDPPQIEAIARGLRAGAAEAGITIPGGELAQLREIVHGRPGGCGFDLAGTCVGLVYLDRLIVGRELEPDDVIVGLAAAGIHSNGLTLARAVLHEARMGYERRPRELGGASVGEELLRPTRIYVRVVLDLIARCRPRALAHITGDGLLNLARTETPATFRIEFLPDPPGIFRLLQRLGRLPAAEMYTVFNMGIGFCAVVPRAEAEAAVELCRAHGVDAWVLGRVIPGPRRRVELLPLGLVGEGGRFRRA